MRATWVDAGNDPDWTRLSAHRITAVFLPVSDPAIDVKRRLSAAKTRGYATGLYMAWNWDEFDGLDGASVAEWMHTLVSERTPAGMNVKTQFDIEEHDPEFVASCLERWRALRPKQDTSWTFESFQGGWMTPEFVTRVVNAKTRVVPQCYAGAMLPVDTLAAARDLTKAGFPDSLISPFYDAADLPLYWDGFAFTMGRLP